MDSFDSMMLQEQTKALERAMEESMKSIVDNMTYQPVTFQATIKKEPEIFDLLCDFFKNR